jgi:hypothetical protein
MPELAASLEAKLIKGLGDSANGLGDAEDKPGS